MALALFLISFFYCVYAPFTKVEESFNIQAMHDILFHRFNISQFDHHEFPGVVPRTFIGPLLIALPSFPFAMLLNFLSVNKFWAQYLVRLTLTGAVTLAWSRLRTTLAQKLGPEVTMWFTAISLTQFHFIFYMSRPLPNVMALPLVLLAVDSWMKKEHKKFLFFAGAAIIIFRAELVIYLGLLLIYDLFHQRITIKDLLKIGIPTGIGLVGLTVAIDSFFWQRLLWPEAEVLFFNTVMNKSSEWGTSPFLWYFYSALPRALGFSLIFVPFGLYAEPRIRAITIPALVFVLIYSFLPHKELRFIVYIFPMLNIASACACHRLWINRMKSFFHTCLSLVAVGHLLGNFLLTVFLLTVSGTNYPGGVAMSRLHRIASAEANISIHIDNLTAQSGVTRFTEIYANWTYSKNEHLKAGDEELHRFDYLLTEVKNKHSPEMRFLQQTHEKLELVECFSNIGVHYTSLLPIKIRTKPCIMILKRKPHAMLLKSYFEVDIEDEPDREEDLETIQELPSDPVEEESGDPPKLIKKRLRSITPKEKIREIIEAEKMEVLEAEKREALEASNSQQQEEEFDADESTQDEEVPETGESEVDEKQAQPNIRQLFSDLDLSAFCDLSKMDTKECLEKILEDMSD